jgi:hypothetical protein
VQGVEAAGSAAHRPAPRAHVRKTALLSRKRDLPPHPTPYTLHPTPYTPHLTHQALHPTPYTLHPAPCTLHPAPCTLHPAPCTLHPNPCTQATDRCWRNQLSASAPAARTATPGPFPRFRRGRYRRNRAVLGVWPCVCNGQRSVGRQRVGRGGGDSGGTGAGARAARG